MSRRALGLAAVVVAATLLGDAGAHAGDDRPSLSVFEGGWGQPDTNRGCIRHWRKHLEAAFVPTPTGVRGRIEEVFKGVVVSVVAEYTIVFSGSGATLDLKEGGKRARLRGSVSGNAMRFERPGKGAGTVTVELRATEQELVVVHGRGGRFGDPNQIYRLWRGPAYGARKLEDIVRDVGF